MSVRYPSTASLRFERNSLSLTPSPQVGRRRKVYAVDLYDDGDKIERYKAWHAAGAVPAAVTAAIRADDIRELEIWLVGNRMVLIMEQGPDFDPEAKALRDGDNPDVQAWDALMRTFQKPLPFGAPGSTWLEMDRIYSLDEQP